MTGIDIIFLAVLVIFIIRGIFRGFLLELFDFISLIVGYFVARLMGPSLGWWMADTIGIDRIWTGWLATIIIFLAVTIGVRMIAQVMKKVVHATPLGGPDRFFGGLFGAFKMVLLAMAIFFLALMSPWADAATDQLLEGRISRVIVSWTYAVQDMVEEGRTPSEQLFASWLRAAGVNDEAVHIVSDQPDLFYEIIEYARDHELNVPVHDILSGDASLKIPIGYELDESTQQKLVNILEETGKSAKEKAEEFWQLLSEPAEETI